MSGASTTTGSQRDARSKSSAFRFVIGNRQPTGGLNDTLASAQIR